MIVSIIRYLFLTLIILVFLSLGLTQVPYVKQKITERLVELAEDKTGYKIAFNSIELMLPFEIKAEGLEIFDQDEKAATVKRAVIRISPYSLLKKQLHLHSIFLDELTVYKREKTDSEPFQFKQSEIMSNLPSYFLSVGQIKIDQLYLDGFFQGIIPPHLDVDGTLLYDPERETARFAFTAAYTHDPSKKVNLDISAFKEEDLVMLGFNSFKSEGEFCTLPKSLSFKAHGRLLGTWQDFEFALNDPYATEKYSLSGFVEQDFSYCPEDGKPSSHYGISSLIELGGDSLLRLIDTNIKSQAGSLKGNLAIDKNLNIDFANIQFNAYLAKIVRLLNREDLIGKIDGSAQGDIFLQGSLKNPYIKVKLKSNSPVLFSENPEWIEAFLKGNLTEKGFVGSLELALSRLGKTYASTGDLFFDGKTINLQNLALDLPFLQGVSQLSYDFDNKYVEASLNGKSNHLETLGALLNYNLSGSAEFQIEFKHDKHIYVKAEANSPQVEINGTRLNRAKGQFFFDEEKDSKGNFIISAKELRTEALDIDNLEASLIQNEHVWDAKIQGTYENNPLALNGQLFINDEKNDFEFYLDGLEGSLYNEKISLLEPFSLKFNRNRMVLSPIFISFSSAIFFLSADYIEGVMHTSLRVDNFPLRLLPFKDFFDQTLEGHAKGSVSLYGDQNSMRGNVQLELNNVIASEDLDKKLPPLNAVLNAEITENNIFAKALVNGIGKSPLTLESDFPFRFKLDPKLFYIEKDQPFSTRLYADGPVTPLLELFFVDVTALSGYGMVDLLVNGTWNDPHVEGKAELTNGTFDHYVWGTALRNIKAEFGLEKDKIILRRFFGSDGDSGTVIGSGEILLNKELAYALEFEIKSAQLIKIDEVSSIGSGGLRLEGNKNKALIKGMISLDRTLITLPKKIPEVLDAVPINYIEQPENELLPTPARADASLEMPIEFHIDIQTDKPILIRDDDLYSEWRGRALIEGRSDKPLVNGELKLIRGGYKLNGKEYELSQGRIHFGGNLEKKTTLSILASKEIEAHKVEILVKGKLLNPDLILRSSPPLSRQQILSLIIFGSFSANGAFGNNEEQMVQSLNKLSKGNSSGGVLTKIQKNLGIDHIEFLQSNTADGTVRLRVGKYLTPNVCLYLDRGINDDMNRVALEAKIRKNIRAELEAADNGEGQISLFWRKSY